MTLFSSAQKTGEAARSQALADANAALAGVQEAARAALSAFVADPTTKNLAARTRADDDLRIAHDVHRRTTSSLRNSLDRHVERVQDAETLAALRSTIEGERPAQMLMPADEAAVVQLFVLVKGLVDGIVGKAHEHDCVDRELHQLRVEAGEAGPKDQVTLTGAHHYNEAYRQALELFIAADRVDAENTVRDLRPNYLGFFKTVNSSAELDAPTVERARELLSTRQRSKALVSSSRAKPDSALK